MSIPTGLPNTFHSMNTPSHSSRKHDPYAALRVKEFLFFLTGRFFTTLAIQMQSVIIGWQIYQYTKDEFALGMIGLSEAIPFIIVSLFSGYVADTYNRKYIILTFSTLLIGCTSVLLYFSLHTGAFIHAHGVQPIYIVISFIGVVRGFLSASTPAFMSQIIPRSLYGNAATWNSSTWETASVIGPAIAGLICAIGFDVAYKVNVGFLCIAVLAFSFIASKPLPKKEKKESLAKSLSAGVKFVFNNQLVLGAITLDLFAVLFGGAVAMLPAYADKVLHVGAEQLGLLRAAPALGAVTMAIIIAHNPPTKNAGRNLLIAITGFGLVTVLFGLSTNYYLSFFLLLLTGVFDNVSVVIRQTILQLSTPDDMRGRVSAVNNIFIGSSNEIGAFESGIMARTIGLKPSVVFGGIMTMLVVAATAKLAPKLRNLNMNSIK